MTGSRQNQPRGTKAKWALSVAALALLAATMTALLTRPPAPTAPVESPAVVPIAIFRTNLVLVAGRLCMSGESNAFTGLMLEPSADGALRSRSSVSNGLLHGISEGWHTNGQLQVTENFKEGVSRGLRTKWHPNGTRLSEAVIVDGKLHGPFRRWSESGAPAERAEFVSGQPNGIAVAYFASGFLKTRAKMKDGKVLEQTSWKDGEHRETMTGVTTATLSAKSP